ncbi:MAG: transglutaminase domain-containing protein [Janthinobacterium lividum]
MARKLLLTASGIGLMLSLLATSGYAQTAPAKTPEIKFGKPDPADFEAKNFVADSAAKAVVLFDYGTTRFHLNGLSFQMETERTTRIKILKKSGYEYATVEIPLYHRDTGEERISGLKGFTYNEVGGKIEKAKLDGTNMFSEDRTKSVRVRKFTLPNVHEGTVIEYSYSVASDFLFNLQPWTFQRDIPTRWSEFRAEIPEYFDYKMLMQGYEPLALSETKQTSAQYLATERVQKADGASMGGAVTSHEASSSETIQARATSYHWAMKDVPALREEPYMTTPDDYVARIDFELAGTQMPGSAYHNVAGNWSKINEELLNSEEFGLLLDRAGFLKELMQPLAAQHPDPRARAAAVRELILKNVKHDGTSRCMASGSLKRTWEQHRGTSADINLLFIAALRQAGLPAQPVVLSTRAHGRINQSFPLLEQYNYVVGVLPLEGGKDLLLDATEPLLPCGMLPARCLNQTGRLISGKEAEGRWVALLPAERHSHFQDIKLTVDAQGNLSGQVREEHGGYAGASARKKLQELGEKKYLADLVSQHSNWEVPTYKFSAVSEVGQSLSLSYELRQAASTPGTAAELYIKPLEVFGDTENPFRHEKRTYPVDFGALTQDVVIITLSLPAGYVAELPKATNLSLPNQGGRYLFAATSPTPGTVQLVSRLTLDKPIYGAEEYGSLREFYRLALAKQAEALVLRKQ